MKQNYTRKELLKICKKSFVPQPQWLNRDSCESQLKLGQCYALLKAGCEFQVMTKETEGKKDGCITDDNTIWLRFWVHDFMFFEYGNENDNGMTSGKGNEYEDVFYLPTKKRLKERKGKDWY